jgi:hypothetical protein
MEYRQKYNLKSRISELSRPKSAPRQESDDQIHDLFCQFVENNSSMFNSEVKRQIRKSVFDIIKESDCKIAIHCLQDRFAKVEGIVEKLSTSPRASRTVKSQLPRSKSSNFENKSQKSSISSKSEKVILKSQNSSHFHKKEALKTQRNNQNEVFKSKLNDLASKLELLHNSRLIADQKVLGIQKKFESFPSETAIEDFKIYLLANCNVFNQGFPSSVKKINNSYEHLDNESPVDMNKRNPFEETITESPVDKSDSTVILYCDSLLNLYDEQTCPLFAEDNNEQVRLSPSELQFLKQNHRFID